MLPLAYSFPWYGPHLPSDWQDRVRRIRGAGFDWVVLHPTWGVDDGARPTLAAGLVPALSHVSAVAAAAVEAGLTIRYEPHLDFRATLTGGAHDWRRRLWLDPAGWYASEVLGPLLGIALSTGQPAQLSLSSELDVSLVSFADEWAAVTRWCRQAAGQGIELGHKINASLCDRPADLRALADKENQARGHTTQVRTIALKEVDYLAVSFYPELRLPRTDAWWDSPETAAQIAEIAAAVRPHLLRTSRRCARAGHRRFSIGEFGVAADPARPYHYNAARPAERQTARRKYCLGLLQAFGAHEQLLRGPVAFWSAGAYDVLGLLG